MSFLKLVKGKKQRHLHAGDAQLLRDEITKHTCGYFTPHKHSHCSGRWWCSSTITHIAVGDGWTTPLGYFLFQCTQFRSMSAVYCHTFTFTASTNRNKQLWVIWWSSIKWLSFPRGVLKSKTFSPPERQLVVFPSCVSERLRWRAVIWAITLISVKQRDCSSLEEHWYRWFEILEMSFLLFLNKIFKKILLCMFYWVHISSYRSVIWSSNMTTHDFMYFKGALCNFLQSFLT